MTDEAERTCARCSTPFTPRRGGRAQRYCTRRCGWRTEATAHYRRTRERALVKQREHSYGLSAGEYDTLVEAQSGACAICHQPETSMRGDRLRTLSVDHDHATGRVRALLCNRCNRAIGNFGDSPELLRAAAAYLEERR